MPVLIKSAADLVTSRQATRDGFIAQALAKNQKAVPYIAQAQTLWANLQSVSDPTRPR